MENSPAGATGAAWAGAAAGAAGAPTSDEGREDGALVVLAGRVLTGAAPRMAAAAAYEIVGAGVAGAGAAASAFSAGIGRSGSSLTAMVKGLLIRDSSCTVRWFGEATRWTNASASVRTLPMSSKM